MAARMKLVPAAVQELAFACNEGATRSNKVLLESCCRFTKNFLIS